MRDGVAKSFCVGGTGSMIGAATAHPFDLIKVRLQVQGEAKARQKGMKVVGWRRKDGIASMAARIWRSDGVKGFFSGVSASALRQIMYSGVRFAAYDVFKAQVAGEGSGASLGVATKAGCALAAGALGAFAGNPADLAMVRMQADGKLSPEMRRNYRGVFDALAQIARREGVSALWGGVGPCMARASVITVGHLAAYDVLKQDMFVGYGGFDAASPITHFGAAISAAALSSIISNPIDVVKTRTMNATKIREKASNPDRRTKVANPRGRAYTGAIHCAKSLAQEEGYAAFYKGFFATLTRQVPYVCMTWVVVEQMKAVLADENVAA